MTWSEYLTDCGAAQAIVLSHAQGQWQWEPTAADRRAAWELHVELVTRITSQELHFRAGTEEAALQSLVDFFKATRGMLTRADPGCWHFATLATLLLNQALRPFTARWHARQTDGKLATGDDRHQFRQELRKLQTTLRRYARVFGGLIDRDHYVPADTPPPAAVDPLGAAIPFDICFDDAVTNAQAIRDAERAAVRRRRAVNAEPTDVTGLAISGGGIRSATFALGVVQRLAQARLLRDFDYLSTVSGGGYLGAFLSSFLNDADGSVGAGPDQLPFRPADHSESAPLRHLRNRSKALLGAGLWARLGLVAQALYGIAMSIAALLPVVAVLAVLLYYARWAVDSVCDAAAVELAAWAIGVWLFAVVMLPVVESASRGARRVLGAACFIGFVLVLAGAVIALLLAAAAGYAWLAKNRELALLWAVAPALPVALTVLSVLFGWERWPGKFCLAAAGVAGPLLLVLGGIAIAYHLPQLARGLVPACPLIDQLALWAILAATAIYMFFLNANLLSPHGYYRRQLVQTYLLRRDGEAGQVRSVDRQPLTALQTTPKAPYHLINAAVNVPSSDKPNLRGRHADFFLFSKSYCGSTVTGYHETRQFVTLDPALDLGTAMAISGAAASPQTGTGTIRQLSFLLGVLNVRLGYWLPNPAKSIHVGPGAWYLLREMFGSMHEDMAYLNVSDGGHIENLGLYELLRRRCKLIVCIDGEADPTMCFGSLLTAIRFAEIDLGTRVTIELNELRLQPTGRCLAHYAMGRIEYPGDHRGLLLYLKSSLTGNESELLLDYRRLHPAFPHDPTSNQLYDEAQFEAYRALGYHVANDLFRDEFGLPAAVSLRDWFATLARNLLDGQ
jgi:hypothetical protein